MTVCDCDQCKSWESPGGIKGATKASVRGPVYDSVVNGAVEEVSAYLEKRFAVLTEALAHLERRFAALTEALALLSEQVAEHNPAENPFRECYCGSLVRIGHACAFCGRRRG